MTLSRTILLAVVLLLTGCASPRAFTMPESTPDDFVLALTVFGSADAEHSSNALIPARYIVEPNATLRASIGPGSAPTTYPKPTRMLSGSDIAGLWAQARSLDLTNPESELRVVPSPETFNAPADQSVYLLEIRSRRVQRAFAIDASNPDARALAEHLADLAWVHSD